MHRKTQDQYFVKLKFCPEIYNDDIVLATLSGRRKQVKVNNVNYTGSRLFIYYFTTEILQS